MIRVNQKPYTTPVEANGRPDEAAADEAWRVHRQCNDSQINDIFCGQLKSTVTCSVCDQISVTFDPFTHLTIPLPKKNGVGGSMLSVPTSLDQCLEKFTEAELLGEDDLWSCPSCQKHRQATKRMTLSKLPKVYDRFMLLLLPYRLHFIMMLNLMLLVLVGWLLLGFLLYWVLGLFSSALFVLLLFFFCVLLFFDSYFSRLLSLWVLFLCCFFKC